MLLVTYLQNQNYVYLAFSANIFELLAKEFIQSCFHLKLYIVCEPALVNQTLQL